MVPALLLSLEIMVSSIRVCSGVALLPPSSLQSAQTDGGSKPGASVPSDAPAQSRGAAEAAPPADSFTNPVAAVGPDPWVISYKGFYYYTHSTGFNLRLWKTRDLTDLRYAEHRVIWTPPPNTAYSEQLWAPELHRLDGKWYLYFAADDGENRNHRIFVLENESDDPEEGEWTLKGMISDPSRRWAIDPTVLELNGKRYLIWSGWPGDKNTVQNLYIAELANPWTIEGKRQLISKPEYPWEKQIGHLPRSVEIPRKGVNEAPEVLVHADQHGSTTFVTYSASGCWTDSYALGLLTLASGKDPMRRRSWTKTAYPLLSSDPAAGAYGTGHNGFLVSPDGTQSWIIYHANPEPGQGCGNHRSSRMQPFSFSPESGTPIFGVPVPLGEFLTKPSGTPAP